MIFKKKLLNQYVKETPWISGDYDKPGIKVGLSSDESELHILKVEEEDNYVEIVMDELQMKDMFLFLQRHFDSKKEN